MILSIDVENIGKISNIISQLKHSATGIGGNIFKMTMDIYEEPTTNIILK